MADTPADKPNPFQPFTDIVGGQRDEGFVNLSSQMSRKIDRPTSEASNVPLVFNASTNKWEAYTTPACRIWNSVDTSCNAATLTNISFNTETFDTDNMHDAVTNPSRITFNTPGRYVVGAMWQFINAAVAFGPTQWGQILINGGSPVAWSAIVPWESTGGLGNLNMASSVYEFAKGDFIQLWVYQNTAIARLQQGNINQTPCMYAYRLL